MISTHTKSHDWVRQGSEKDYRIMNSSGLKEGESPPERKEKTTCHQASLAVVSSTLSGQYWETQCTVVAFSVAWTCGYLSDLPKLHTPAFQVQQLEVRQCTDNLHQFASLRSIQRFQAFWGHCSCCCFIRGLF